MALNYNVNVRRLGTVLFDPARVTPSIFEQDQFGVSTERWVIYEQDYNNATFHPLNAGASTTWTSINLSTIIPPGAVVALLSLENIGNATLSVRKRNVGPSGSTDRCLLIYGSAANVIGFSTCPVDAAGYIDYRMSAGTGHIYFAGYIESL